MLKIQTYVHDFSKVLNECTADPHHQQALQKSIELLKSTKAQGRSIFLIGNGGSSAICEHMAVDLTKNAGLRAHTFSGSPLLTAFANDYGYEHAYAMALEKMAQRGDVLIAISSSGSSKNILNACNAAKLLEMQVITFSGFLLDNPLRSKGDINIWVNSKAYGYVELIHNFLIHYINDAIIGQVEYVIQ